MTKYSLKPEVKNFIEWNLENYFVMCREIEEVKRDYLPAVTPSYSAMPAGVGTSSPTEAAAMKIMTSAYLLNAERTIKAVSRVIETLDNTDKKLIELIYWKKQYNVIGAGMVVGLSKSVAYEHVNKILSAIALNLGLVNI